MPAANVMTYSDYTSAFALGITKVHDTSLAQHKRDYTVWLAEESVKRWRDTEWSKSGLGQMPEKGMGEQFSTDTILTGETKEFTLTPWGLAVVVVYEAMRWEIYGIFSGLGESLARAAADRYMVQAYSLLNNSFSAPNSNYKNWQAENMIATSHVRMDGGSWSNRNSSDPGLSYLGVQQALIDLGKTVDQRGFYGKLNPQNLITGVENMFLAEELFSSGARPDQANPNVVNTIKGKLRIHTSPYITSTTAWWVTCDKNSVATKLRMGDAPKLERDSDVRTKNLVMTEYMSFNIAVYDALGWWGSTG